LIIAISRYVSRKTIGISRFPPKNRSKQAICFTIMQYICVLVLVRTSEGYRTLTVRKRSASDHVPVALTIIKPTNQPTNQPTDIRTLKKSTFLPHTTERFTCLQGMVCLTLCFLASVICFFRTRKPMVSILSNISPLAGQGPVRKATAGNFAVVSPADFDTDTRASP